MAKIILKKGLSANLPAASAMKEGWLLFTTDTHEIYWGPQDGQQVKLYDGLESRIDDLEDLVGSKSVAEQIKEALKTLIVAGDNSVDIATTSTTEEDGTTTEKTEIKVKVSKKTGNALKVSDVEGEEGLYVELGAAPEYTIVKDATEDIPTGLAAVYHLQKDGVNTGVEINIPKDLVLKGGSIVNVDGEGNVGTFIKLVLNDDANTELYIDAAGLVEYVSSGSTAADMVVINIDANHKVTATITDGTVTKSKLEQSVQNTLNKADSALQASDITEGTANGTIAIDGTDIKIHGLGDMAYENKANFALSDTAVAGKYVSSVSQTDGVITVTRADLPSLEWEVFGEEPEVEA